MASRVTAVISAVDKASPALGRISKAMGVLGAAAVAVGAIQLGRSFVRGMAAAAAESSKYESAAVRLAVALRNQGENTEENRREILAYSKELQTLSVATETQIVDAIAAAKAYGASTDAAKSLALAATELAGATGQDLDSAFRQVNRTLGGYAGELGEVIPELKNLTQAELQAGKAADVLLAKFKGAGAEGADTYAGAVNNLGSAFTGLQVTIGGPLLEVATEFLNSFLTPLVRDLDKSAGETDTFRASIIGLALAFVDLLKPIEVLANNAQTLIALLAVAAKGPQGQVAALLGGIKLLGDGLDLDTDKADALRISLEKLAATPPPTPGSSVKGEGSPPPPAPETTIAEAFVGPLEETLAEATSRLRDFYAEQDALRQLTLENQLEQTEEGTEARLEIEMEMIRARYDQEIRLAEDSTALIAQLEIAKSTALLAQKKKFLKAEKKLEDQRRKDLQNGQLQIANQTVAFFGTIFERSKAVAIAQAVIDTAAGVLKVQSVWAAYPPVAAALTALTVAIGAAQIAKISSASFADGGFVGGPRGAAVAATVHGGELILNEDQQEQIFSRGSEEITVAVEVGSNLSALAEELSVQVRRGTARLTATDLAGVRSVRA